jgi:hypothetical protein
MHLSYLHESANLIYVLASFERHSKYVRTWWTWLIIDAASAHTTWILLRSDAVALCINCMTSVLNAVNRAITSSAEDSDPSLNSSSFCSPPFSLDVRLTHRIVPMSQSSRSAFGWFCSNHVSTSLARPVTLLICPSEGLRESKESCRSCKSLSSTCPMSVLTLDPNAEGEKELIPANVCWRVCGDVLVAGLGSLFSLVKEDAKTVFGWVGLFANGLWSRLRFL